MILLCYLYDTRISYLDTVENTVLNGLTSKLRHPDVIAKYVRAYHEERKRLAADADARRMRLERRWGSSRGKSIGWSAPSQRDWAIPQY